MPLTLLLYPSFPTLLNPYWLLAEPQKDSSDPLILLFFFSHCSAPSLFSVYVCRPELPELPQLHSDLQFHPLTTPAFTYTCLLDVTVGYQLTCLTCSLTLTDHVSDCYPNMLVCICASPPSILSPCSFLLLAFRKEALHHMSQGFFPIGRFFLAMLYCQTLGL